MKRDVQQRRFAIRRAFSDEPVSEDDTRAAEVLLAKLVARSFLADHSELFQPTQKGGEPDGTSMDKAGDRAERMPED